MYTSLQNKTAIVTGAGSGIGQSIAVRLAEEGAKVLVVGRSEQSLKGTASLHANIDFLVADITKTEDNIAIVVKVQELYGRLDILVNNAGVAPVTHFDNVELSEYDCVFDTNVRAVVDLASQTLPFLKATKGTIINLSSAMAGKPVPRMANYAASKAAVNALTQGWSKDLAQYGIRVNALGVGPIETPIYDKTELDTDAAQAHKKAVLSTVPMARFGTPGEVASVVAFLASDQAAFITGAIIAVDGGVNA